MQVSESQAGADCAEEAEGAEGEAQERQERTDEEQWEDCRGEAQKQEPNSYESSMVGSVPIVENGCTGTGVSCSAGGVQGGARFVGCDSGGSHDSHNIHLGDPPQIGVGYQGKEGARPRVVDTPPRAGFEDFSIGELLDDGAKTPSIYGDNTYGDWCDGSHPLRNTKDDWSGLSMQAGKANPVVVDHVIPVWPDLSSCKGGIGSESSKELVSQPDPLQDDGCVGNVCNGSGGGPGMGSPSAGPHGGGGMAMQLGAEFCEKVFGTDGGEDPQMRTQGEQLIEIIEMHAEAIDQLFSKVCSLKKWASDVLKSTDEPPAVGKPKGKGRSKGKKKTK